MSSLVWIGVVVVIVAAFLVFATKKRWVSWKDSGMSALTAFHDFQPKDKQHAIEIVMEQKAGKKLEEQDSGQDKNGKPKSQSPNLYAKGTSASGGKSGRD
jgi:hypothetical protein